jgi:hypothetical protein
MFSELKDKSKFKEIRESEKYRYIRNFLDTLYGEICIANGTVNISFELESEFLRNGNRVNFEEKYFLRRKQLSIYAIMAAVYPNEEKYIRGLQNIICDICNEHSWQLPAHRPRENWNRRDDIDLFAAETGLYLAEIKYMLGDRLNPLVNERIANELEWRIVKSFENNTFWWEKLKSNWAAVCAGGVGGVFIYEAPNRFEAVINRITACMDNYLSGINDEGSTSEGAGYWVYGFSFFALYYDLCRRATSGKINGFKSEKVRKLSGFLSNLYLDEKNIVLFSDAPKGPIYPIWLMSFLKDEYDIVLPPGQKVNLTLEKFSVAIREVLCYGREYENSLETGKVYYKELQWYIERKKRYSIAIKGGNNAEEHNHNDIGSFMITHNKCVSLCDLGVGEYTADYCGDKRYTVFETSALGHSIPIINGMCQVEGKNYCGKMNVSGNIVEIDMKKAYNLEITKLNRRFELFENNIVLTDSFDLSLEVKERFITEIKPEFSEKYVKLGNTILFISDDWTTEITHKVLKYEKKDSRDVYILDFTTNKKTDNFIMSIKFTD